MGATESSNRGFVEGAVRTVMVHHDVGVGAQRTKGTEQAQHVVRLGMRPHQIGDPYGRPLPERLGYCTNGTAPFAGSATYRMRTAFRAPPPW